MIDPGELNRRLVLEAPVETADGAGGVTRSYATVTTLWAAVRPASARGDVVAAAVGRHGDASHHRARALRSHDPASPARRPRIFRIVALRDHDGTGRFVEIAAEERVD